MELIVKSTNVKKVMIALAVELYYRIQEPRYKIPIDKDDYFSVIARTNDIMVLCSRQSYYDYDYEKKEYTTSLTRDYQYMMNALNRLALPGMYFGKDHDKYGFWVYNDSTQVNSWTEYADQIEALGSIAWSNSMNYIP